MDGPQVIPWYSQPTVPDAWHHVRAPGGYEWWYFDAEDPATDTQIVAILFDGFVFHPGYLRQYDRYRRNPTKIAPPVPSDYPCAYFIVYRAGKIWAQFMTQHPPQEFDASSEKLDVKVGPNHATTTDGAIHLQLSGTPWKLTWQGPRFLEGTTLAGQFHFKPRFTHAPSERLFFSKEMSGAEHHWVLANPLCDVVGSISLGSEAIQFTGQGYHDHNYGTGPIGPGLRRWIWGRAIFHSSVVTFHHAVPCNPELPNETHLLEADRTGIRELKRDAYPDPGFFKRTGTLLSYPDEIKWRNDLRLVKPRIIDSSPFYLRINYDAWSLQGEGTAFCEVAYPHRLRWPVLGRMIEMSIWKP